MKWSRLRVTQRTGIDNCHALAILAALMWPFKAHVCMAGLPLLAGASRMADRRDGSNLRNAFSIASESPFATAEWNFSSFEEEFPIPRWTRQGSWQLR